MKKICIALILFAVVSVGCTSMNVRPVDSNMKPSHICIKENQLVRVDDFVQVVRDGLDRYGITSEVFSDKKPEGCTTILTYTALRNWDVVPYMYFAELRIEKDGKEIGYAEYRLVGGKGGLSLAKYQGTKAKLDPVIDELFKSK
jgi:hypothetical protein